MGIDLITNLLKKAQVDDYQDLTPDERRDAEKLLEAYSVKEISIDDFREYVSNMRMHLDAELAKFDNSRERDLFLKARLQNCILFEQFLFSPDRAQKTLKRMLEQKKLSV